MRQWSSNKSINSSVQSESNDYPAVTLTPTEQFTAVIICFVAWLIPGGGHFYLGKYNKSIAFFILLNGLFAWGMLLQGQIAFPIIDVESIEFNLVNILIFIFGFCNGGMTIINLIPLFHYGDIAQPLYEIGTLFMLVSGALNIFVLLNAWDLYRDNIAKRRKK